jgi:NADPH:quinone reductase-like Zn-dependent oxidoreductase
MRRVAAHGKLQPEVIGHDFAGTVTAVGAAVTQFDVGDEVFLGRLTPLQHLTASGRSSD